MVADDRFDDVDEGWGDGAEKRPVDPPTSTSEGSADAESSDKVDTAKSRVVRLVERPVRTDPTDDAPPASKLQRPPL